MDETATGRIDELPARLVVVRVGTGSSGVAAALDRLASAIRAEGRFGVIIDARGADDTGRTQPGRVEQVRRLRALRPGMQAHAAGVAFVTAPVDLGQQRKRLRAARLMLGCPVNAFDTETAALDWLAERGVAPGESPGAGGPGR